MKVGIFKKLLVHSVLFLILTVFSLGCGGGGGGDGGVPPNESEAEATIGPEGGVVEVTDSESPIYGAKFTFPAGCLDQDTLISLKYDDLNDNPELATAPVIVSHDEDVQFNERVSIVLPLKETPTEDTTLMIMIFDDGQNVYVPTGLMTDAKTGDNLSHFQLTHLSGLSLIDASMALDGLNNDTLLFLISLLGELSKKIDEAVEAGEFSNLFSFLSIWHGLSDSCENEDACRIISEIVGDSEEFFLDCLFPSEGNVPNCVLPLQENIGNLATILMLQQIRICDRLGQETWAFYRRSNNWSEDNIWDFQYVPVSDSNHSCMGRCGEGCPDDGPIDCCGEFRYTQACLNHDLCVRDNWGLASECNYLGAQALLDCNNDTLVCTNSRDVCDDGIDNNGNGQIDEGCFQFDLEYRYPISQNIGGIALSPDDSTLYVAYWTDTSSDRVEWFSTEAPYNLIDYVAYGRCHKDVGVSTNNHYIFTTTYYSSNVSRFDLLNNMTQDTLPTTSWPATLALTPDRLKMVVFGGMDGRDYDMGNDALHIFDISNDDFYELCTIPMSDYLEGNKMAITEDGEYGYFLTGRKVWDGGPAKLNEVSLSSCTVTRTSLLPSQTCYGIALGLNKLYISDFDNSMIRVYDRQTFTEDDEWSLENQPVMLAIPPDRSGLFVLFPGAPGGGALEVLNIDNGNKMGGYPELGCNSASDFEFNSDGSKVYISCSSGDVLVLNVSGN